jgi:hypothetical protein
MGNVLVSVVKKGQKPLFQYFMAFLKKWITIDNKIFHDTLKPYFTYCNKNHFQEGILNPLAVLCGPLLADERGDVVTHFK